MDIEKFGKAIDSATIPTLVGLIVGGGMVYAYGAQPRTLGHAVACAAGAALGSRIAGWMFERCRRAITSLLDERRNRPLRLWTQLADDERRLLARIHVQYRVRDGAIRLPPLVHARDALHDRELIQWALMGEVWELTAEGRRIVRDEQVASLVAAEAAAAE